MSVARTLARAREILGDPHVWIKGDLARDADNKPCLPTDPNAKRFDIAGAVERAAFEIFGAGQAFHDHDMLCLRLLRRLVPPSNVAAFNDDPRRDHAHVLKLLNHAIAVAKAEEQAPTAAPLPAVQAQ
jgi:hypothetical protein